MRGLMTFLILLLALVALAVSCVDDPGASRGESEATVSNIAGGWLAETRARVGAEQYRLKPENGAFVGVNPAQRFTVEIDATGVAVSARKRGTAYDWIWTTVGVGRDDVLFDASRTVPGEGDCVRPPIYGFNDACLAAVAYDRDGYVEWYANRTGGLEQGFEIFGRTYGGGPLVIEGKVSTPLQSRVTDDLSEIIFSDRQGDVLRYSGLSAWDAHGVPLDAWMTWVEPDTIRLFVDDTDAAYPLTVDPGLSAAPDWTWESDQGGTYFGHSVSGAGDVNADGYGDVIVGAYYYDNGQNNEGAAFVFLGSNAGLQTSPVWSVESNQEHAWFGQSVSGAGDVNADGYDDVIVGAHGYDNGENNEGRAYVFLGDASGVQSSPVWTAEGDVALAYFGYSVSGAGDVDADGYDDIIVGARRYTNGQTDEGRAYVFLGEAAGVQSSPDWTAEGDQTSAFFGVSVSGAGDVDNDGYDDVIVGAHRYTNGQNDEGRAYVFLGSNTGVQGSPGWMAESDQESAEFGWSVSGAGDVNGDGYDDVIVGARYYNNGQSLEGRAYVFLGAAGGVQSVPIWTAESDSAEAQFGWSVAGAGDVNNDGYDDVISGGPGYSSGQMYEGVAMAFLGEASGVQASPVWSVESDLGYASFGVSVSGAGDVNGDGADDVIVGAEILSNGQTNEGRAYVYHGLSVSTTTTTSSSTSTSTSASTTTTSVPATTSTTTTTDSGDDDTGACIICETTSECTDALGAAWGCVDGCCEDLADDDAADDDAGSCIICQSTLGCTDALGAGWGCVDNCCENFSDDDSDDDTDTASDAGDDDDDSGCGCGC
ncbi:MAG: integrin alpha [Deltaproteobacteria bacterium]|nr:integrin alpha [Deltaproteobacteria bacterium]